MKQATTIRLLLLGLPLGLIVIGVGSLLVHTRQDPSEEASPAVRRLARSTVTTTLLESYLEDLTQKIGPRHFQAHPEKLSIAGNYIESTVGPHNMGYEVTRQPAGTSEGAPDNLIITIRGGKLVNETVVVCAHYDAAPRSPGANENATGVAALFALAEAFVDQRPDRTLRLAFLANGAELYAGTVEAGAAGFVRQAMEANTRIVAAICLDGLGWFTETAVAFTDPLNAYFPPHGNFLAVIGPPSSAGLIRELTQDLGEDLGFPLQGALIDREAEAVFGSTAAAAFIQAGIPCALVRSGGSFSSAADPSQPDDLARVDLSKFTDAVRTLVSACHRALNPRSR